MKSERRAQVQGDSDPQNEEKEKVCKGGERRGQEEKGEGRGKIRKRPKDESKKAVRWQRSNSRNG